MKVEDWLISICFSNRYSETRVVSYSFGLGVDMLTIYSCGEWEASARSQISANVELPTMTCTTSILVAARKYEYQLVT